MNGKYWMKKIVSALTATIMAVSVFSPGVVFAADANPNLALGKTATSSDDESTTSLLPQAAFDGDRKSDSSRWSGAKLTDTVSQWLAVDLGSNQTVKEVDIYWRPESAGLEYTVQTSTVADPYTNENNADWIDVATVKLTEEQLKAALADTPMRYVLDDDVTARHIRVYITKGYFADTRYPLPSIFELEVYGKKITPNPNLALGKTATASSTEHTNFPPSDAFDGDRTDDASRWSSTTLNASNLQWIKVDLGSDQTVKEIDIYWREESAGTEYKIQTSTVDAPSEEENSTDWVTRETVSLTEEQLEAALEISPMRYVLPDEVTARHIRVYIAEGLFALPTYRYISIHEIEVYGAKIEDASAIFASIDLELSDEGNKVELTEPSSDKYEVEIIGSDAKEIVGIDGTVTTPLVDKTVNLLVRLENPNNAIDSYEGNLRIKIPGVKSASSGNAEPTVIPSLREWSGGADSLTIDSSSRIVIADEKLRDAAEYTQADFMDLFGFEPSIVTGSPQSGDIYLSLGGDSVLGEEGYYMDVDDYVTIEAPEVTGAFYGTRTVLQILKASGGDMTIPKGEARDYPKYERRGIQLDVARKFVPLYFLQDYLKLMSWYKMNFINVHLNDNGFPSYFSNDWSKTYSSFRLESDEYPGLTSTDGSYTKDEFRQLQIDGAAIGVDVIPEIDTPGHSLHLTKYKPELYSGKGEEEYLDVLNPESLEFVKGIFTEYLEGDDPVFIDKVNIGTDEYDNSTQEINEAFRNYTNELLTLVKSYGKQPYLWGALSDNPGTTVVNPEGAMMLAWNNGYANPTEMAKLGWDMISINDGQTYIVPVAGYYSDYQDSQARYNGWEANNIGNVTLPPGHPRVKGGALGVWNDIVGNGISSDDLHDRMMPLMTVFAEKLWQGKRDDVPFSEFAPKANVIGESPRANISWRYEDVPDNVIMDIPFGDTIEDTAQFDVELSDVTGVSITEDPERGQVAKFDGGSSYIKTSVENVGFGQSTEFTTGGSANLANGEGWSLSMSIKPDADNPDDAVLFESSKGQVKLKQTTTGKIGFSKEVFDNFVLKDNYNHRFDYEVDEDVWTHIVMVGNNKGTSLYVNGELVEMLEKSGVPGLTGSGGESNKRYMETLVLPTETIGSETNSFSGLMDDLKIYNKALTADEIRAMAGLPGVADGDIPLDGMTFEDGNHQGSADFAEAFDNDTTSIWHTSYDSDGSTAPRESQYGIIHLPNPMTVDGLRYLPRPTGSNGYITSYKIQVSRDEGVNYETVAEGNWASNGAWKIASFVPQEGVTDVKLISVESVNDFTSAAEIRLTQPIFTGRPAFIDAGGTRLYALTADKMSVTYVHENGSGAEQNLKMLVAVYSPEGKLVHTAATDAKTAAADGLTAFSVTLDMPENVEGLYAAERYTAGVFLWDSETFVPVLKKVEFK